ncbi:MAG TPA: T9SS type A sorting domain-containing protein [Methylomirabilota bacterium]|nr:T9SS type A sorting domain-containing protein [Methylomirabilota bacterium]
MNRSGQILLSTILIAIVTIVLPSPPRRARERVPVEISQPLPPLAIGDEDDPDAQAELEFLMSRDPRANAIPRGIRRRELQFARSLIDRRARPFRAGAYGADQIQALDWVERGPRNVGGRTRAFAVDVANPSLLLAGSVGGGIWRSLNDGASWSPRTSPGQIHNTTCIAQDRRAGHTTTWYVGTGEIRGSTTNATRWGALYLGDGVFKSTDNGLTWALLPATASGTPQTTDPFDYVNSIATNPANSQDEVLAATYRGIYRSVDGGGSWSQVIASDSGYTDVAVTSGGAMYAITRTGSLIRVWRSTNGTAWTLIQPASFPTAANRIVIGLAPSNAQIAYFFAQGVNGPSIGGHQFWKYTYLSGNGSGAGGTWENRTTNLPPDIFTQTGYDQILHVKPDDANFVIIGGTDLYRSTDGFASTGATTLIGGYPYWPDGVHHPDQQSGAFSPSSPNVYYSANDGGVQKAADITIPSMVWTTLNHGYNVTQFYSVAIAPDAGSNVILAGAQDNGSRLGNAPGLSDWTMPFGGDGTIVEVSPASQDRLYTQYQNGFVQRMRWNGTNIVDITPDLATNRLFVNPIVLDPNNPALLYYAGGGPNAVSGIWRNSNAPAADTLLGWTDLFGTDVGDGVGYARRISALGISTANNPNVLYLGSTDGIVKRVANANTATPSVSFVPPPGLNAGTALGGFVRCIAVDPTNSDRALVAFGNYNFPSLWYTTNGGANWTDVEGNLAGPSGPSVRWATMFYVEGQLMVFLGTSIGVLSTTALSGPSTVWVQEAAATIGNVPVVWMDFRSSDNTLAVATHARGVFTTRFLGVGGIEPGAGSVRVVLGPSYPNPTNGSATITYELPRAGDVSLRLYDVAGREVALLVNGPRDRGRHAVPLSGQKLAPGVYRYELKSLGSVESRMLIVRR